MKKTIFTKRNWHYLSVTAVVDLKKGCVYNPEGIPLEELINSPSLIEIPNADHPNWNAITLIHNAETDAIVELSYTNLRTGEPAVLHIREAILSGKHVVTSNKGPIALHYRTLNTLARENNVKLGIEGTVMSGTPALRLGTDICISRNNRSTGNFQWNNQFHLI